MNKDNDDDDQRLVYIRPSGDRESLLPMTRGAARLSGYLRDIIDLMDQQAFQLDDGPTPAIIPLCHQEACNGPTMKNIIRWCEYHCDDPKFNLQKQQRSSQDESLMNEEDDKARNGEEPSVPPSFWDRRFLADIAGDEDPVLGWKNRADLYDLLIAAHFLQINPIVEIGGKFICQAIRERNVEQVRAFLGIINDLTDEETRTIQAENEWAFNRHAHQ